MCGELLAGYQTRGDVEAIMASESYCHMTIFRSQKCFHHLH